MVKAYEIPHEVEKAMGNWLAAFDDNGEQLPDITDEDVSNRYEALKAIENRKNEVAEWALGEYANLTLSSESLTRESERIAALATSEKKKAERLLSLVRMLVGADVEEKPSIIANWKVGYQVGTGSLEIDENADIPEGFKRYSEQSVSLEQMVDQNQFRDPTKLMVVIDEGAPEKKDLKEEIVKILESDEYKARRAEAYAKYELEVVEANAAGETIHAFQEPDAIPGMRIRKDRKFYVKAASKKD